MKAKIIGIIIWVGLLFAITGCLPRSVKLVAFCHTAARIRLISYNGLREIPLCAGELAKERELAILAPHLPRHEILNYCVSRYYQRSMVTLASQIMEAFPDAAVCPGGELKALNLPADLPVVDGQGASKGRLADSKGDNVVNDEKWRQENLAGEIKLPFLMPGGDRLVH